MRSVITMRFSSEMSHTEQNGSIIDSTYDEIQLYERQTKSSSAIIIIHNYRSTYILPTETDKKPKKMYGKEYMGVERSTFLIDPQGIITDRWLKVRVKGHVEEVMARLMQHQGRDR